MDHTISSGALGIERCPTVGYSKNIEARLHIMVTRKKPPVDERLLAQERHLQLLRNSCAKLLLDVAGGKPGAQRGVLEQLGVWVQNGVAIEPEFQAAANLILSQALIAGKLPIKKKGRRTDNSDLGFRVAARYFEIRDSGVSQADATWTLEKEFCKEERQIFRLIRDHKDKVGATAEIRSDKRGWWKLYTDDIAESGRVPLQHYIEYAASMRDHDTWVKETLNDQMRRFAALLCVPLTSNSP